MARSLHDYLAASEGMARLATHAKRLQQLQRLMEALLPETLRPYARVANFQLGKLIIHAANGAVAAKVRQFGPRIASELSFEGTKVTQIEVKVQARPGTPPPLPPRQRPPLPGGAQQEHLAQLARQLPESSSLKQALQRLLQAVKE